MTQPKMLCFTHGFGSIEKNQAHIHGILHIFQGYLVCRQKSETHETRKMESSLNCGTLLRPALVN